MTEIRLDRDYYINHTEIYNWCTEHFGAQYVEGRQMRWGATITFGHQFYQFAREEDASFFTLMWIKG